MSSISSEEADRHALVSSFYGPGAVIGWYLTALACLISFGLHHRKRRLDTITADLVANYSSDIVGSDSTAVQKAACIEATLIVVETSLAICVILFLLAAGFKCVKRGCFLAAVGDCIFSVECYLYFSRSMKRAVEQSLDRSFMISFEGMMINVMGLFLISIVLDIGLIVLFFLMRPRASTTESPRASTTERPNGWQTGTSSEDAEEMWNEMDRDFRDGQNSVLLRFMTMLFQPFVFIATLVLVSIGAFENLPSTFLPRVHGAAKHIARNLIPRSNTLVTDLDQAVAILAGATVFGFSLYSVAEDYY